MAEAARESLTAVPGATHTDTLSHGSPQPTRHGWINAFICPRGKGKHRVKELQWRSGQASAWLSKVAFYCAVFSAHRQEEAGLCLGLNIIPGLGCFCKG